MEVKVQQDNSEENLQEKENLQGKENHKNNIDKNVDKNAGKKGRYVLIVAIVLLLIGSAYIGGAVYFTGHFYPNTLINHVEVGKETTEEALNRLNGMVTECSIQVYGRNQTTYEVEELFEIKGQDVDFYSFFPEEAIQQLLSDQNSLAWFLNIGKNQDYRVNGEVSFSEEKLDVLLEGQPSFQPSQMVWPSDAYLSEYREESNSYEIVPEVKGTLLDVAAAKQVLVEAMGRGDESVNLEEQGCYTDPLVTEENEELLKNKAKADQWLATDISYDWNGKQVLVNSAVVKDWILNENGELSLQEDEIGKFVKSCSEEYDTYGKNYTYHTVLGYDLTLRRGSYGWKTDVEKETAELTQLVEKGYSGAREPVYAIKARQKGVNDIGSSYVEADMTHQHLYLYQDGQLVLESDFVSGDMTNGNRTPEGIFGITYKTMNAVLRGADYVTPVTYWMPFYGNYGMHDATWRDTFGGDIYLTNGSHGCLNLPLEKAGEIYQYMTEGFPVICYYYPEGMLPQTPEVIVEEDD